MRSVPALAVVLMLLTAGSVAAEQEEGTVTIDAFGSIEFEIDNTNGKTLTVSYDIEVTDGPTVNVFFLSESDYQRYSSGETFRYYVKQSNLENETVSKEFEWSAPGRFFLVIDNSHSDPDEWLNTTVQYDVTWETQFFSGTTYYATLVMVLVVILAITFLLFRKRRAIDVEAIEEVPLDSE